MSYKYSRGSTVQGDIKAADDTQRDTMIDFEEDRIDLKTAGSTRFKISGSNGNITFNEAFTFPNTDGSDGQVLKTNGNGTISWQNESGGSTPAQSLNALTNLFGVDCKPSLVGSSPIYSIILIKASSASSLETLFSNFF